MSKIEKVNGDASPPLNNESPPNTEEQIIPSPNKEEQGNSPNTEVNPLPNKEQVNSSPDKEQLNPPPNKEQVNPLPSEEQINPPQSNEQVNPPRNSQRKLRLNRRGFHLINHPVISLLSEKSDQEKSSANGLVKTDDKIKTVSPQKKIISLSSVKSNSSVTPSPIKSSQSSTTIKLKTTSSSLVEKGKNNSLNTEVSSSSDSPPKKKHKPITWP